MLTKYLYTIILLVLMSGKVFSQQEILRNDRYEVVYDVNEKKFTIEELSSNKKESFTPTFVVLFKAENAISPKQTEIKESVEGVNFYAAGWKGEMNLFDSQVGAIRKRMVSECVRTSTNQLTFSYENSGEFKIEASLYLPEGNELPYIEGRIVPQQKGYFSMAYYGAPEYNPGDLDELWQPLVWTDKIFPKNKYLIPAHLCSMPGTMLRKNGVTVGVFADPSEYPFSPLPTMARSRFGVAIHNNQDKAQPMLFTPIMGSSFSSMLYNETYSFKYRLYVSDADISLSYAHLAQKLYGFGTKSRNNVLCSLNETFENMMEYCLDSYSKYDDEFKGYSYETDVTGSVRNTSMLHALNLAFITDNKEFYTKRAIPVIEFLLSRDKDLFSIESQSGAGGQSATNTLGNPSVRTSELALLYKMGNKTNPFLLNMAVEKLKAQNLNVAHERSWKENMALYNVTQDPSYSAKAKQGADTYIEKRLNQFEDDFNYTYHSKSSFWSALAPKWIELFELYESTHETKYLDAAYEGALRFSRYLWMSPAVPDSKVVVNIGGKAPVYGNQNKTPIAVPQESVDAWRLSEIGLHAEAAGTSSSHRAVFMANHAPYMLRIAALKGDTYLREIAKNAVIGRYRNFPGYHINTDRTTVYEKTDFPLRTHEELTSTSMHYSHIVPMTSLILDYMVSDVVARSEGKVSFESQFVEAFAYLQGRTYCGYGTFYDTDSISLYMPSGLLADGHQQLNYISARKKDTLYLIFSNQSVDNVQASYNINTSIVDIANASVGRVLTNNMQSTDASLDGSKLMLNVPANGLVAIEIKGAKTTPQLQNSILANNEVWQSDFVKMSDVAGNGMVLNLGKDCSSLYVYSSAPMGTYDKIKMLYETDDNQKGILEDNTYPFEFSLPLGIKTSSVSYKLVASGDVGEIESVNYTLEKVATLTMTMEGNQVIYTGEQAEILCHFTGDGPYDFTYKYNNALRKEESIVQNPYKFYVNASENLSVEPIAILNQDGEVGIVSGFADVLVATDSICTIYDTFVSENNPNGNYRDNTQIEIKNSKSWSREGYFSFNISSLDVDDEKFVFRAYLGSMQPLQKITLLLYGNNNIYDSQLCWSNKDIEPFEYISEVSIDGAYKTGYVEWDITSWVKSQLRDNKKHITFRIRIATAGDALCRFYSAEWNKGLLTPSILAVKTTAMSLESTKLSDVGCLIYPNPVFNSFRLLSETIVDELEIWSLSGSKLYRISQIDVGKEINISNLSPGVYIVKPFMRGGFALPPQKLVKQDY